MWNKITMEFPCSWENMDCCMETEKIISAMMDADTPLILAESNPYIKRISAEEAVDLIRANDCKHGKICCHSKYAHATIDLLWKARN